MERERGISVDYYRSMFYWAPVSINNAQAQTFSQENKPDAIYGLAIMTEYRLVSDLPLILRPDWSPKAWNFFLRLGPQLIPPPPRSLSEGRDLPVLVNLLSPSKKTLDWGTRLEPLGGTPDIKWQDDQRNFAVWNFCFQDFLGWKILASIFLGSFIILSTDFFFPTYPGHVVPRINFYGSEILHHGIF